MGKKLLHNERAAFAAGVCAAGLFGFLLSVAPVVFSTTYIQEPMQVHTLPEPEVTNHLNTPPAVKAIYMSQCVAGSQKLRNALVALVDDTELNSIVIDVKDYSGRISFESTDPRFSGVRSEECFVSDMREFLQELHTRGIYTIARITVFQDPYMATKRPDIAVQKESMPGVVWKDRKGVSYIDPGARDMWEYIIALAKESYHLGFDEINFDYIRFPSDGDMNDIYYPISEPLVNRDPENGKVSALREFFSYLHAAMTEEGIPHSADVFGMTTTNPDDLNIGQVLEEIVPFFDYVAPMVYPSHYPRGFLNLENPAAHPYEVIFYSMNEAFRRSSTTPKKMRPWLQDFSLGATYTASMVREQIQATYDAGFDSWMLWNASNRYTREALDK